MKKPRYITTVDELEAHKGLTGKFKPEPGPYPDEVQAHYYLNKGRFGVPFNRAACLRILPRVIEVDEEIESVVAAVASLEGQ